MSEFDPQLCEIRHFDIDRRVSVVETNIKDNLTRIYDKLDTMGQRPSWAVTVIVSLLSSGCIGMAVFLLTRTH